MWLDGLVGFPPLCLVAEWVREGRRPVPAPLAVALVWTANFYTAYMATIGAALVLAARAGCACRCGCGAGPRRRCCWVSGWPRRSSRPCSWGRGTPTRAGRARSRRRLDRPGGAGAPRHVQLLHAGAVPGRGGAAAGRGPALPRGRAGARAVGVGRARGGRPAVAPVGADAPGVARLRHAERQPVPADVRGGGAGGAGRVACRRPRLAGRAGAARRRRRTGRGGARRRVQPAVHGPGVRAVRRRPRGGGVRGAAAAPAGAARGPCGRRAGCCWPGALVVQAAATTAYADRERPARLDHYPPWGARHTERAGALAAADGWPRYRTDPGRP